MLFYIERFIAPLFLCTFVNYTNQRFNFYFNLISFFPNESALPSISFPGIDKAPTRRARYRVSVREVVLHVHVKQ